MKYDINSINKRKKNIKILKKILGVILIILIYNIILAFLSSDSLNKGVGIFGYKACIITSSSMEPSINYGDLIIIKKCKNKDLNTGDVITFRKKQEVITHRIIKIEDGVQENESTYITKGDNNNTEDIEKISYSNIEGKCILTIPKLGKLILVIDNKIIILVIILILLILGFWKIHKYEQIENRREKKKIEDDKKKIK